MTNYGIFTDFVFCRFELKKEIIPAEKKKKSGKCKIPCRDIVFVYRDRTSSTPEELCRSQQMYVTTKSRLNSRKK